MTSQLYYTPPEDKIFEEVKQKAIELWKEVDEDNDKFGYASGKINRIKDIGNIEDNLMYMVAMFDHENQEKLAYKLSWEARTEIRIRMVDGGTPEGFIPF